MTARTIEGTMQKLFTCYFRVSRPSNPESANNESPGSVGARRKLVFILRIMSCMSLRFSLIFRLRLILRYYQ